MILQQAMMKLSQPGNKTTNKLVMLHQSELAIHKDSTCGWVVSHFKSGKSVLKHIKERKDVDEYVDRLLCICEDWTFTLKEFDESEWKHDLKVEVDKIQQEIYILDIYFIGF